MKKSGAWWSERSATYPNREAAPNNGFERPRAASSVGQRGEVDDRDKATSFGGNAISRRSTQSLGAGFTEVKCSSTVSVTAEI